MPTPLPTPLADATRSPHARARPLAHRRRRWGQGLGLCLLCASLLAGCGSAPKPRGSGGAPPSRPAGPAADRDGPGDNPPPDLMSVPDAEPRVELLRPGGPNKPYVVLGQGYTPLQGDAPLFERGLASWYGRKFHGRQTASGEPYDMYAMSAAHRTMPLPSYARVRNPANGRSVVVRVNDRGPFHPDRVIDLSYTAALKLGLLGGVAPVEVERLTHEMIRSGAWRLDTPAPAALAQGRPPAARTAPATAGPPPTGAPAAAPPTAPAVTPATAPAAATGTPLPGAAATPATTAAASPDIVPPPDTGAPPPGVWLQLGAFKDPAGAAALRERALREAEGLAPQALVLSGQGLHRVQLGPFTDRDQALQAADRVYQRLHLMPALVERR